MDLKAAGQSLLGAADRALFTKPPRWSQNPLQLATGRRLKPGLTFAAAGALIGSAYLGARGSVRLVETRGFDAGLMAIPRYSADAMPNDPTLGATGDLVFGLRSLSRRY